MRTMSQQLAPEMARSRRPDPPAPAVVLAQRQSTLGGGATTAPPIRDAGRPLEPVVRQQMEHGFGTDFAAVRVHDDARAHDSARDLGARAYAAGNDLVFGAGHYRPETAAGRSLIAHELAHTVHQGGVQMQADGPIPATTDRALEAEADRAAAAVTAGGAAPALSRIGRPAVLRSDLDTAPPGGAATPAGTAADVKLPPGMTVEKDEPAGVGTTELAVNVHDFKLPKKGRGKWVKEAFDEHLNNSRLFFQPVIVGNTVKAFKEGSGADYKGMWLNRYGFTSWPQVAAEFAKVDKPEVAEARKVASKTLAEFKANSSLTTAKVNVDHIVEKQLSGVSQPANMQLLGAAKNQAAGGAIWQSLLGLVSAVRDPNMRGPEVRNLTFYIRSFSLEADTDPDPEQAIEEQVRAGNVRGTAISPDAAAGDAILIFAGGPREITHARAGTPLPVDDGARRIVHGMWLNTYDRNKQTGEDIIDGRLDSRAANVIPTEKGSVIKLRATKVDAAPVPASGIGSEEKPPAGTAVLPKEVRRLDLLDKSNKKLTFHYPYLSEGSLNELGLGADGRLTGKGKIDPSIPLLKTFDVEFTPEALKLTKDLDVTQFNGPLPGFRFTKGSVGMRLSPDFFPSGELSFEVGPPSRPLILGDIKVGVEGTSMVATGTLKPGTKIPGIQDAEGSIRYHSASGWSGALKAKTSSFGPGATVNAELGFRGTGKETQAYGQGGLQMTIKGSPVDFAIHWDGKDVTYKVGGTIANPLPRVKEVKLSGRYANDVIWLAGVTSMQFGNVPARLEVIYSRKEGEEGKFSGTAEVDAGQISKRAGGKILLALSESGRLNGKGAVWYQLTDNLRPTLGVELDKDERIKISGEVQVGTIPLSRIWPGPKGGQKELLKGGIKFPVPTPIPTITFFGEITGALDVGYGVGPVEVTGVVFSGELYPLEDDPKVKAGLRGALHIPAYGELYGTFGANVGLEVAGGALGGKGGVQLQPKLRVQADAGINVDAKYEQGGFSFEAVASARGHMEATLSVKLVAEVYALYGLVAHDFTYDAASYGPKRLGPEFIVTLGRIAYGKDGKVVWPSLSQIEITPKEVDPIAIVQEIFRGSKAVEK